MQGWRAAQLLGALTLASLLVSSSAHAGDQPRAVIELFTSQGCSSCPPADKLLSEFSNDPSVIALSLAVDYWDYIGWKDTLALPGHANRQKAYSRARGDRDVYTPQAIINGGVQALGSDSASIEQAMVASRRNAATLSMPVMVSIADGKITATAPAGKIGNERAEVWLCPVARRVTVAIGRGENSGRSLTYNNVVRRWIKMGEWTGVPGSWSIPLKDALTGGADEVAVIVQSGTPTNPGPMLAAALSPLR
jgi:hypothetical protein